MSKPIKLEEFELEKGWWNNPEENEHAWKVSIDEIKERNYNLDIKNPNDIEELEVITSQDIITKLDKSMKHTSDILNEIKSSLS